MTLDLQLVPRSLRVRNLVFRFLPALKGGRKTPLGMRLGYSILSALLRKLEELSWIFCTMTSFYYLDQNLFRFFFHNPTEV